MLRIRDSCNFSCKVWNLLVLAMHNNGKPYSQNKSKRITMLSLTCFGLRGWWNQSIGKWDKHRWLLTTSFVEQYIQYNVVYCLDGSMGVYYLSEWEIKYSGECCGNKIINNKVVSCAQWRKLIILLCSLQYILLIILHIPKRTICQWWNK